MERNDRKMMKVNCVVVTYNRLNLLKECLSAVERQTYPVHKIIVVDNCSTDGTAEFLDSLSGNEQYMIIRPGKNIGGSGGFSLGLKTSVLAGCDYTWMMDDDTIPSASALKKLAEATGLDPNTGFVCSQVNWTDGTPHVMNKVALIEEHGEPPTASDGKLSACRCKCCTFVSVLVNTQAVLRVGLPIKEFFIWCDDIEYTVRIFRAGYACFYVAESVVTHKTHSNYSPHIHEAPESVAWKFYYQARNRCYLKHRSVKSKLVFYLSVWNMYRIYRHRIAKRKDGKEKKFLEAVKKGCKDGLTFYPEIEYVHPQH